MADLLDQLRTFYSGLDATRRRVLWGASALSLAAIAGVGFWASAPSYVVLTRAGDADEAAAVTQALSAAGVPFTVDSDGRTVRVPSLQEVDARRAASGDDGIVGLEGLEKIDPWVTPFQEQLHRQRMIQGELVRTIDGIAGVQSSTVHLDLPEPSAFLRDVARAGAAVTIRPDPGTEIDSRTARSIAQLVSHAVSGMETEDVTVVDASSGRTLWGGGSSGDAGMDSDLSAKAAAREASLASGVRTALAQLLGRADAAAVTVRVELETAAVQTTVNAVDPLSSATQTERVETENDTRGLSSGGVPGTDSNVPERASSSSTGGTHTRESTQTTYQFTTTTTTTTTPAGDIRRLSASVIIDSAAFAKAVAVSGADGKPGDGAVLRAQIESAVRAALGSNAKRTDEVVVTFLPFVTEAEAAATSVSVAPVVAEPPYTLIAVGIAALVVVLALVGRTLLKGKAAADPVAAPLPGAAAEDEETPAPIDLAARLRSHLNRLESHTPREVSDLVRLESSNSAEVVRRWLHSS